MGKKFDGKKFDGKKTLMGKNLYGKKLVCVSGIVNDAHRLLWVYPEQVLENGEEGDFLRI